MIVFMATQTQPVVTTPPAQPSAAGRLMSLDAFRGATIAFMVLVNNPGSSTTTYPPLLHASWHGWTPTDLVFPFFLWIVGVAMTLSFEKRIQRGDNRGRLLLHAFRRAAAIFLLGLLLNGFPYYDLSSLRIPGVLQRIAVCYLIASAIFLYTRWRGQLVATGVLLGGYWLLMRFAPIPGCPAGTLEKECNFARYIDSLLLSGHMWSSTKTWDPEGIVSTLPAIATVMFGIFAGHILRARQSLAEKTVWLFAAGVAGVLLGLAADPWLPINKNIWTSSYSLFTAGLAFQAFALSYWLLDGKQWRRWASPFVILGLNAIAVYVFAGVVARLLAMSGLKQAIFDTVCAPVASPQNASLLYALMNVGLSLLFAWLLYRRGWFLKV